MSAAIDSTAPSGGPRPFAPLAALVTTVLLIGLALAYLFATETPTGRVTGRVYMVETKQPLADADIYLNPSEDQEKDPDMTEDAATPKREVDIRERRYAHTDSEGRFTLTRVPIGKYSITATSPAHASESVSVWVSEAKISTLELPMKRSESDLAVATHQSVFGTAESPILPVRGYVDAKRLGKKMKIQGRDTLQLRVYKTRLSNILQDQEAAQALNKLRENENDDSGVLPVRLVSPAFAPKGAAPQLVTNTTIPITTADREGFFHQRLPLGVHGAGLYLIQVNHAGAAARSWVLATDTALVVKRSPNQLLAYAVNLRTGTPVPGAHVRSFAFGKERASGDTDKNGIATLSVAAVGNADADAASPFTVATRGDDEAVVSGNDYFYEEHGSYVVHAYTDRTVYRPGDTVSYKAIARRKRADGSGYDVPRGIPVEIEIRDPNGDRLLREAKVTDSHGAFHGTFDISSEAPSGSYSVDTKIGGESHTSDVMVASYRKPEFSVTVTPTKPHYVRGETVDMTIEGKFYFGAPVAGAKVHYSVFRDADWSAEYGGDPDEDDSDEGGDGRGYYGATVIEGDVTLGDDGKAVVHFPADPNAKADSDTSDRSDDKPKAPEDLPQAHIFTLTATVTDDAKREVSADGEVHVSAGDFRLNVTPEGYLAAPGHKSSMVVRAQDPDGKPVANVPVELTPSYTKWNEETKEDEVENLPVIRGTTHEDGTVLLDVIPPRAGDMKVVAKARDSRGHTLYDTTNLWVSGDEGGDLNTDYGDLSLHTDKRRYQPGESARVLVNADRVGETVLLTVEGEQVYATYSVPITKRSTVVWVPVSESYGPNVTLAACYVRDKKFAQSDTPLRVSLTTKTLKVAVTADKPRYQPGDSATYSVKITDAHDRPVAGCPFSLGVVDESIYALRADTPKAMQQAFYPHRDNRVSTDYSFNVRYLGDADKSEPKITARKKFRDTAFWQPDLETDASGTARVTVPFPDNLTTWRATVYACTDDTALGYGQSKVIVTKPFFVRLDTPRFLTQGDQGRFLTIVHNDTGADQSVQVRLKLTGIALDNPSDTQTVTAKAGQDAPVTWPLTAKDAGDAAIRLTAWTTASGTQYTDGIEKTIPVKPWGRQTFTAVSGVLDNAAPSRSQTLLKDNAAVPGSGRLTVRVTPSVSAALVGGLDYLVGYPYGCTEQTLSRFVPDLLVQQLQRTTGRKLVTGSVQDKDLSKMVGNGLTRLRGFQHGDTGGWGWWEHDQDDAFMTAYVLYGLTTAKEAGYTVSDDMLEKGRKAAIKLLAKAPMVDKPFLLYALALAGDTETPAQEAPKLVLRKIAPDGLAYLVLMEKTLGYNPRASIAYAELERRMHTEGSLTYWKNPDLRWNGSDRMATALGLRALLAADPADSRAPQILRWLMKSRTDGYFGDTRDTAWVIVAFHDYIQTHPADAAPSTGIITVSVNGKPAESLDATAVAQDATRPDAASQDAEHIIHVSPSALHSGANELTVASTSGATVFYTASLTQTVTGADGQSLEPLAAAPQHQGLTIKREYLRVLPRKVGNSSLNLATEDTGNRFNQGDNVRVRLTINAPQDLEYILIEDAFPSSFEPTERGTAEEEENSETGWGWWYSNVDVRDDRIAIFARTIPKGQYVFEYNLRAQTPGKVRALPAQLQGMYASDIRVETGDTRLEVSGE